MKKLLFTILLSVNLALTGYLVFLTTQEIELEIEWPEIAEDSAVSYSYKAELVRVIDGDTIVLDIDLGFETWLRNQPIRLYGIDTPEITGPTKQEGLAVKTWLEEQLHGRQVILQSVQDKKGKFGRWLGIIFADGENLNDELIETGRAKPL